MHTHTYVVVGVLLKYQPPPYLSALDYTFVSAWIILCT